MAEPPDEKSKQALITALRLLAASPKSQRELRTKLEAKGYPVMAVQFAMNELSGQGVLDDKAYAKNLTTRLMQGSAAGRRRVAFELKHHGVPEKVQREILGSLTESNERARALELARSKWPSLSKLEPAKRKKKLFDHLIRKGYDYHVVRDVLETVARDTPDDDPTL
ncbi:MAG TPA: regulatory protein RecX [Candidatus Omnitrophota bacterium]|nr:regulatory protein RecX [Candidatus Omnitrophota bacterium]